MFLRRYLRKQKLRQYNKFQHSEIKPKPLPNQATLADKFAPYLETRDLLNISRASKDSYVLFNKATTASKTQILLKAVVFGDYKKAEYILNENPELLLEKGTVKDFSGRTHARRTAFQLALGAGDFNVKDKNGNIVVHGMVEMMENYFKMLPGKTLNEVNQIIYEQYRGQFPKNYEAIESARINYDSAALHQMFNAIANATDEICDATSVVEDKIMKIVHQEKSKRASVLKNIIQLIIKADSNTNFEKAFRKLKSYLTIYRIISADFNMGVLRALYEFRYHLTSTKPQMMGKHFNYELFIEAAELYEEYYVHFGNHWSKPRNLFCWQKIFGCIQRYLPACDAQCMAQGLWYILEHGEKSKRSLEFRQGSGSYYPLDSELGLNVDWDLVGAHYAWSQAGFMVTCADQNLVKGFTDLLSKLVCSKDNSSLAYSAPRPVEKRRSCVVM